MEYYYLIVDYFQLDKNSNRQEFFHKKYEGCTIEDILSIVKNYIKTDLAVQITWGTNKKNLNYKGD